MATGAILLVFAEGGCRLLNETPRSAIGGDWARGPVRWLLLPEERRRLRGIRDPAELEVFVEAFWARRGDLAILFSKRVASADRLYGEEETRGALTDRGGALILLGPPDRLKIGQITVPDRFGRGGRGARTRSLPSEHWIYDRESLRRELAGLLRERGLDGDVGLVFLRERGRTRLVEGRETLKLAARAWLDTKVQ